MNEKTIRRLFDLRGSTRGVRRQWLFEFFGFCRLG
jgi:hypothetical protein